VQLQPVAYCKLEYCRLCSKLTWREHYKLYLTYSTYCMINLLHRQVLNYYTEINF
jgi:hypothetical protein